VALCLIAPVSALLGQGVFSFECIEGDTLLNDPYCDFCTPGVPYEMWGLKVTSPSGRVAYILHPYSVEGFGTLYVTIRYDVNSTLFYNWQTQTSFSSQQEMIDSISGCPVRPPDAGGARIDTFQLRQDSLFISLEDDNEPAWHVVFSDFRDSSVYSGAILYREYWRDLQGDSIRVTLNDGRLPDSTAIVGVYVEGWRNQEGPGKDYTVTPDSGLIVFDYNLQYEDVEVRWLVGSGLRFYREIVDSVSGDSVNLPDWPLDCPTLRVRVEGWQQQEGPDRDYLHLRDSIFFNYTLDNEDVLLSWILDGTIVHQELFEDVFGDVLRIDSQGLPVQCPHIWVYVEGWPQSKNDYWIDRASGVVRFNYALENEDVELLYQNTEGASTYSKSN